MTEHLNYCRQMVKFAHGRLSIPNVARSIDGARWRHIIDLSAASQKFMLPHGGRIIGDTEARALERGVSIRLPHPFIALEFYAGGTALLPGQVASTKRIVFAREDSGVIRVTPVLFSDSQGVWVPYPDIGIPMDDWFDREQQGRIAFKILFTNESQIGIVGDYQDELSALMDFINALACSNVHAERMPESRTRNAMRRKGALPFDEYHVLTIDVAGKAGSGASNGTFHRSPREHLRRGHIRRLQDGRKLWVNATVVNPGVGGKVKKDYAISASS